MPLRSTRVLALCALSTACSGDPASEDRSGDANEDGGSTPAVGPVAGSGAFGNADATAGAQSHEPLPPGQVHVDCAGETQRAERVQVDMYVMLDRSGSMLELTGVGGTTKWDAVRAALTEFVSDPESEGLGVGLQYFPLGAEGIPEQCLNDTDCGVAGGPCTAKACLPPRVGNAPFATCLVDADCPPNSPGCAPFGECSGDATLACFNFGAGGCGPDGDCNQLAGECLFFASCDPADYAAPAVEIDVLPDNGMALVDSLTAEAPIGLTPTPVALLGALTQCSEHAAAFPDRRVIAVLATDGLPTDCVPEGTTTVEQAVQVVADIAADGASSMPSLETYVIGVFAPEDMGAMQNLALIAQGGGTDEAFVIDASGDVNQQFLAALDEIRGGALSCELELPEAPEGKQLDFNLVNVELTDESGLRSLVYVESEARCGESELGWYYDVPPANGTPTRIQVCDTTCDTLKAAQEASVEIRLGCPPMTPI
jgi:hypothetical protein